MNLDVCQEIMQLLADWTPSVPQALVGSPPDSHWYSHLASERLDETKNAVRLLQDICKHLGNMITVMENALPESVSGSADGLVESQSKASGVISELAELLSSATKDSE